MDPKRMRFDYFYEEESEQFAFYRIPKELFTEDYFSSLSTDAKLLYGLMIDRMTLSRRNQWIDEVGRVYIVFTLEEIIEYLNCGKDKGVKIMAELDDEKGIGLIQRVRQGLGKPTRIYVKNFVAKYSVGRNGLLQEGISSRKNRKPEFGKTEALSSEKPKSGVRKNRSLEVEKSEVWSSENQKSGVRKNRSLEVGKTEVLISGKSKSKVRENRSLEVGKTDSNNNDFNHIDLNDTDSINPSLERGWTEWERIVKDNICYEYIVFDQPDSADLVGEMVAIIVEVLAFPRDFVVVGDVEYPYEFVKEKLLKLTQSHVLYVLSGLKSATPKIANPKSYLLKCLMNAPMTINSYYQTRVLHDMKKGVLYDKLSQG